MQMPADAPPIEESSYAESVADRIAHELNNPLAYVISNLELALEALRSRDGRPWEGAERAALEERLVEAQHGAERMRVVVRGLQPLSRTEGKRPDAIDPDPRLDLDENRQAVVLIVDDDAHVGTALRRVLAAHHVTVVTRADEALELLASGATFDVIFSDLMMPQMSGMALYDELARQRPHVAERMVFMTGGAFTPDAHAFLQRVPNARLEKPFACDDIRELVRKLAGRSDSRNSCRPDAIPNEHAGDVE
jgi:CheY-like chemotaxis protein